MSELLPIPSLVATITIPGDLLAACKASLDADPALMADGSIGVKTREVAWDQADEPRKRPLGKAELPAILLRASIQAADEAVLCGVNRTVVRVHLLIVTRDADNRDGREAALQILNRSLQVLGRERRNGAFLAADCLDPAVTEVGGGDPRLQPKTNNEFVTEGFVDFGVLYSEV